jgi:hypothetical protein
MISNFALLFFGGCFKTQEPLQQQRCIHINEFPRPPPPFFVTTLSEELVRKQQTTMPFLSRCGWAVRWTSHPVTRLHEATNLFDEG